MIMGNNPNQQSQQMMQQRNYNNSMINNRSRNSQQNTNTNNFSNQQSKNIKKKDKQVRMSISFKEDERWIYDILKTYSCPSGIIKDILKSYFGQS